jgi:hypothetical protein
MATFTTTKDDGSQVEISLTKIGEDKATITVKERSTNKNPKKADKKEEHKLKNIKADKHGSKITAKNDGFFNADIEITVNSPEPSKGPKETTRTPTIKIKVSNTFRGKKDSMTEYEISEKDRETILEFMRNSKFPALALAKDLN